MVTIEDEEVPQPRAEETCNGNIVLATKSLKKESNPTANVKPATSTTRKGVL
jgi:hypothetical protein